jgi:hypothetical protein
MHAWIYNMGEESVFGKDLFSVSQSCFHSNLFCESAFSFVS